MALAAPWAHAAPGGGGGNVPGPWVKFSGTVTNSLSGQPVAGATVTLTATGVAKTYTTDANGAFSDNKVQVGSYTLAVSATNYTSSSQPVSLRKGSSSVNVALVPVAKVIVTASVGGTKVPGAALPATGTFIIMDGSTLVSTTWSQTPGEGVPATISDPAITNPTITLGSATEYASELVQVLKSPPITEEDLPPDLKLQPINEIEKGLQDRNQVVGINPLAAEKAEEVPLTFAVTTSSGTYKASVNVVTQLPWVVNPGVRTVPVNVPVMLLAKCGDVLDEDTGIYECLGTNTFSWTITVAPGGSSATLTDANTRSPWFTPDKVGTYQIQKAASNKCVAPSPGTSLGQACTTNAQCNTGTSTTNGRCDLAVTLDVHAGRYHGVIDPILTLNSVESGDGRPETSDECLSCHNDVTAPDNFATWRLTGHAEAFTQGITTNTHFGENCFACHTVGFDRDNAGGIDNSPNYDAFYNLLLTSQAANDVGDMWVDMLTQMPDTARLTNIQCENCHGPQDYTEAHQDQPGAPRVSLNSDVCGSCHGEPARHGRFQQWQLSSHADYDLARERGAPSGTTVGSTNNCARCHSGNGFIQWSEHDFDPAYLLNVTWDQETVVPQTCATCHEPHDTGTTSGSDETNAKVRLMGDTNGLLAGFVAQDVGKAATCMTCHNSRVDSGDPVHKPRNDATWPTQTTAQKTSTPHHGVQADLIMGQNAYFMAPGDLVRGKHSLIPDVCITCHMEKTDPPNILSYNKSGTNHAFAADPNVCSQCHGAGVTADNTNTIIVGYLDDLATAMGDAYQRILTQHYPVTLPSPNSDTGCTGGVGGVTINGTTLTITNVEWVYSNRVRVTTSDGACRNVGTTGTSGSYVHITVSAVDTPLQTFALTAPNENIWKAVWNYGLLLEDSAGRTDHPGARGVHNPDFSIKALTRAITAVNAVTGL